MTCEDTRPTQRAFVLPLLIIVSSLAGPAAFAERIELRLGGERVVIDGEVSRGTDGQLVIESTQVLPAADHVCEIVAGGAQRLEIGSVIADHISIRMDGHARVSVEALTCGSMEATIDGFSRIDS